MNNNNKFWIETEVCIVDHNGEILPKISQETSAFEFIRNTLQQEFQNGTNQILQSISPEELWHQIEIKNIKPFSSIEEWLDEIEANIACINNMKQIREKMQLIITPVSQNDCEVFPALNDENAHQRKLFDTIINDFWENEWNNIVKWFATFSTQVNISGLFDGIPWNLKNEDFQELARRFLNEISSMQAIITQDNGKITNWEWKNRQEIAFDVLSKLKNKNFSDINQIIIPPTFQTKQQMLQWIAQHCWVSLENNSDIDKLHEKNMHSFLAKLKWIAYQGIELRAFDATSDKQSIINRSNIVLEKLQQIRNEFFEEKKIKLSA